MGLYPPKTSQMKLSDREALSLKGKGSPKLKIRNYDLLNQELPVDATIDGYTLIPNYNMLDNNLLNFDYCPFVD